MTENELINDLLTKGGAIVGSQHCTLLEIADAKVTNRFCILADGCGLVRRTKDWLDLQKKREIMHPNTDYKYLKVEQ
jgi:hypothetical protein